MKRRHNLSVQDSIRLLRYTIAQLQYYDENGEGFTPEGLDPGELILLDSLVYLSGGDTNNTSIVIEEYKLWLETGDAPWPYNGEPSPYRKNDP